MADETEEQTLARFQAELQEFVERFANGGKGDDIDIVLVRDWSLVIGAQVIHTDGSVNFRSALLNSKSPTWSLVGLLEQAAQEIDDGDDDED